MIVFAYPLVFALLLLPFIFYALMPAVKGLYGDALKVPFLTDLKRISMVSQGLWHTSTGAEPPTKRFWFLYLIWGLLCLAAARPQIIGEPIRLRAESRDIMLVLDISTSMLEPDFALGGRRATRLDVVKKVVSEFADKRANDRMGLILFGTRAYLQTPLTFDKAALKEILYSMQAGMAGDSTSIGDAVALALKNLQTSHDKDEQVIILLTDGENNDGSLSLGQAVQLAADEKVKIYTIGVGAPSMFFKMLSLGRAGLDEQGLHALAETTKGQYFRAESASDLQKVYNLIDKLEPSAGDERYIRETTELYFYPLLAAVVLALAAVFVLRRG